MIWPPLAIICSPTFSTGCSASNSQASAGPVDSTPLGSRVLVCSSSAHPQSSRQDSFDHYLSLVSRRRRNNASLDCPAIHRQRYCISLASALLSYASQILRPPPGGVMASIWANSSAVSRGSKTAPTSSFSGRKRARRRAWGPKGRWKQYATYGPLLAGHLVYPVDQKTERFFRLTRFSRSQSLPADCQTRRHSALRPVPGPPGDGRMSYIVIY